MLSEISTPPKTTSAPSSAEIYELIASKLFKREGDSLNFLGFAALLLCLCNPYVVGDVGVLLSFSATFGIVVFSKPLYEFITKRLKPVRESYYKRINKRLRFFASSFATTFTAVMCTVPVNVLFFGKISLVKPGVSALGGAEAHEGPTGFGGGAGDAEHLVKPAAVGYEAPCLDAPAVVTEPAPEIFGFGHGLENENRSFAFVCGQKGCNRVTAHSGDHGNVRLSGGEHLHSVAKAKNGVSLEPRAGKIALCAFQGGAVNVGADSPADLY